MSKLATELGVPVLLVRVIDLEQLGLAAQLAASPVAQYAASVGTVRQGVDDYLQSHAATLRDAGIAVETAVLDGSPAPVLNDLTLPGDVLVLTSHGRGGIGRWLLGSVTEKLVREGNTPVIVVRSHALAES
ncbi:MAG: universal stress protein [Thermomicrobiales bacterium]